MLRIPKKLTGAGILPVGILKNKEAEHVLNDE
jgi:hypothetical protein